MISALEAFLVVLTEVVSMLPWGDGRSERRDKRRAIVVAVVFAMLLIVAGVAYLSER